MRIRQSIPAKVFLGFAAVLVTFGAVTAFGVAQMHGVGQGLALVSQAYHPLTRIGAQLEASFRSSEEATRRLLAESDVHVRESLLEHALEYHPKATRQLVHDAQDVIASARALGSAEQEGPFLDRVDGLLAAVLLRYEAYTQAGAEVREQVRAVAAPGGQTDPARTDQDLDRALRKLKRIEEQIGLGLRDFTTEVESRIDLRVKQTRAEERRGLLLVAVFSLVALAVGLFVSALVQRTLSPISRLTEAVKEVGEGRFASELQVASDDELGVLAREFNAMARKLADRERQLSEKTAEVLRSERLAAVGRLAAQITHEIRNPLSSLSLNAELLQEQIETVATERGEMHALVAAMAREVDRLAEITEEYLRFARLPKPALSSVELDDAAEELLEFMAQELAKAKVQVTRELASGARVRADPGQLRQVLLNLVRNAREATGEGGHVTVRTRYDAEKKAALVEVEDDGPGMAEDVRLRIFEPFFSTKERGTGLGLALVQQIVHEHGGELSCESAPGRGTRLAVWLPEADSAVAASAPVSHVPALAD